MCGDERGELKFCADVFFVKGLKKSTAANAIEIEITVDTAHLRQFGGGGGAGAGARS